MAVDLAKNRLVLLTGYQEVIDEASDSNWALYTYEGDSNDLMLAASGGGGLAEISLSFDSSSVMYGFCSLKEATAALPRYVLVNWVGEDVADARKCACASHVATIAEFFQGVDVIINASSVEDIDPAAIGQRLSNGTTASPVLSRLRTKEEERGGEHVGTVYQKTNAEIEMKKINREEFWEQAKREEELRKEDERRRVAEERQRFEEERMELERKEQEERERRYREREQQIEEHRKKMLEDEEAKERLQNQPTVVAEPSYEDPNQEKKESEVEEAKAIIAQRSGNPREFFKQKERAQAVDSSPVAVHRTGRLDSPFLKQQGLSPSVPSPSHRGASPLPTQTHARTQQPCAAADDDDGEASAERNMAAVSPIPKIVTMPVKDEECSRNEWGIGAKPAQQPPVQDSNPTRPVQTVAPQAREAPEAPVWGSGTDTLLDLWDSSPAPSSAPSTAPSHLVDLTGDGGGDVPQPGGASRPQPLLSFDDMMEGSMCSGPGAEDEPGSLVDVMGGDQMTLSYQHALQHAAGEGAEQEDGQLLLNGETLLLKEGTQASEGYFSQSQEEEFGQSEESSAKPTPVFYNKPPEIDITCWDTDPVVDDEDD